MAYQEGFNSLSIAGSARAGAMELSSEGGKRRTTGTVCFPVRVASCLTKMPVILQVANIGASL